MCLNFCLASKRNIGHGWWGHSALRNGRQRTVHEGTNISDQNWLSPVGTGVEGDRSTSSHKTLLILGATGLPSVVLGVMTLSRDRSYPGATKARRGSNRLDIAPLTNANDHHRMMVCSAPVIAKHILPKELSP